MPTTTVHEPARKRRLAVTVAENRTTEILESELTVAFVERRNSRLQAESAGRRNFDPFPLSPCTTFNLFVSLRTPPAPQSESQSPHSSTYDAQRSLAKWPGMHLLTVSPQNSTLRSGTAPHNELESYAIASGRSDRLPGPGFDIRLFEYVNAKSQPRVKLPRQLEQSPRGGSAAQSRHEKLGRERFDEFAFCANGWEGEERSECIGRRHRGQGEGAGADRTAGESGFAKGGDEHRRTVNHQDTGSDWERHRQATEAIDTTGTRRPGRTGRSRCC